MVRGTQPDVTDMPGLRPRAVSFALWPIAGAAIRRGVGFQPAVQASGRARLPAMPAETGWETCSTSSSPGLRTMLVKTALADEGFETDGSSGTSPTLNQARAISLRQSL